MGSDGAAPHRKLETVKIMMHKTKKLRRPMTPDSPSAERKDDGVGDQIAGQDPGALICGGAEGAGNVGQGDIGDRGVEHLHERRKRDRHGNQPRIDARLPRCGRRDIWIRDRSLLAGCRQLEIRVFVYLPKLFLYLCFRSSDVSGEGWGRRSVVLSSILQIRHTRS